MTKKDDILNYKKFFFEQDEEINIKVNSRSSNIICRINNINDANTAKKYIGKLLFIDIDQLPRLKKNQFYFHDLNDLNVFVDEKNIGVVKEVKNHGAGDYLEVNKKKSELLVPLNRNHVLDINLKEKKIFLNPEYYEV